MTVPLLDSPIDRQLDAFFARCDAVRARRAALGRPLSEARLSTILLNTGWRLKSLRERRRIWPDTLAAATQRLESLEREVGLAPPPGDESGQRGEA